MDMTAMEKRRVEDELTHTFTSESKRQKSYSLLETLHDHLDMVVKEKSHEIELKENQLQILSDKLGQTEKQIELQTKKLKLTEIEVGEKAKELDLLRSQIKSEEKTLVDQLDLLRSQIKSEEKTLVDLRTEVKKTQTELELKKQELRPRSSVLVKHEQQPIAADNELFDSDARMLRELSSASLGRREVSSYLRAIPNPAKFALDLLEGQIRDAHRRQQLGLQDIVVQNMILFFEELSDIEGSDKRQMQHRAKQVATLWKGKIIIEAPRSSLEALAFLLFIVAFDLKSLINEEETALLATSVFHHKQGPKLFHLLGLNRKIPEFVRDLIRDHQYIPAVRIICLFNLEGFSAPTLLMKEITNLRQSALDRVENKDVGKLRAAVELVADYKLDIDLPGDLIAKLIFQRDSTPPVLRCPVAAPEEATSCSRKAAQSSVDVLVPKHEFKPFVNPTANGRFYSNVRY